MNKTQNAIRPRRVLVIGLDGATFDLIKPWAAQGHLPNFARLMANSCHGPLTSTIQPTTAPAWVTFMTGVNQGKHGLYDFVRRRPDSYHVEITNSSHIAAPTLFEILSQLDRRSIAINIPYTYPPRQVNGVMIAGPFAASVSSDLVYPPEHFDMLQSVTPDYFILPDFDTHHNDPLADYANKLLQGIEMRERLALHLMQTQPWDLFTVVFMAPDEAQHAYWHCMEAPQDSPHVLYRHVIRQVYQRIDQTLGALMEEVAREANAHETIILVLSDHGAGPLRWMINLNRWLAQAGYLQFHQTHVSPFSRLRTLGVHRIASIYRQHAPPRLRAALRSRLGTQRFEQLKSQFESNLFASQVDWTRTRVYALGAGGNLFINLRGREPQGTVQPGQEYEALRREVVDALSGLTDPKTGESLVRHVHFREKLYHGPNLEAAPDLIIEWADYANWGRGRYDGQTVLFKSQNYLDFSHLPLTGSHRPQGILIAQGPGIWAGASIQEARLLDMAPTILGLLGILPTPQMDGRLLQELLLPGEAERLMQTATESQNHLTRDPFSFSPEDTESISQRLRSLGYL